MYFYNRYLININNYYNVYSKVNNQYIYYNKN